MANLHGERRRHPSSKGSMSLEVARAARKYHEPSCSLGKHGHDAAFVVEDALDDPRALGQRRGVHRLGVCVTGKVHQHPRIFRALLLYHDFLVSGSRHLPHRTSSSSLPRHTSSVDATLFVTSSLQNSFIFGAPGKTPC
eukprot:scaffold744_cov240-Pinguiococcus_pyrenoidosus.AAC.7